MVDGDPDALLATAAKHADLLVVVGTPGLGGISDLPDPHQLVHHTGATVVMVPQGPSSEMP